MFDHIGLVVSDLDASVRFYTAALGPLGWSLSSRDESSAGFGPESGAVLWLYPAKRGDGKRASGARGAHLAIRSDDTKAIARFHAAGLEAGGRDNGPAGPRADYGPTYHAAFLLDPDGNNVEAMRP